MPVFIVYIVVMLQNPYMRPQGVQVAVIGQVLVGYVSVDTNPAFRSTGDIAGPCGVDYGYIPFA